MASVRREVIIEAPSDDVWAAVRDVGAPHKRLAPGFLVAARLEDGARIVTFVDGLVAREPIVDVDDEARRLVWTVTGSSRLTHYNAAMQVFDLGEGRSRLVWVADLLPHAAAGDVGALMDQSMAVITKTLGGRHIPR